MTAVASIYLVLTGLFVIIQSVVVVMFVSRLRSVSRPGGSNEKLPPAAVVLAIRGPDPFIEETVRALVAQQYPEFVVSIVVDHAEDPALEIVERVIRETQSDRIRVSLLKTPLSTCSLKCSSLIQAVQELEPRYEVIAFIDGDSKPHPTWLHDLVISAKDPRVGVATGNRWYMPAVANWGSLFRYYWNAGAVVQVWFNGIVWAGSMAMRRDVIDKIELLGAWSHALSVDATVYQQLRKHGLPVRFVPGVMLINAEQISLAKLSGWVRRQLIAARYCSEGWSIVLLHAFSLVFLQIAGGVLAAVAGYQGNWRAALTAASALGVYWIASLGAAGSIESAVSRIARLNGQPQRWIRPATVLKLFPAMLLTHFVYLYDLVTASFYHQVTWRGIAYDILGRQNIRMVAYRPYVDAGSQKLTSVV